MLADLRTWLFASPRRLVVVSLTAIILIFVAGSSLFADNSTGTATADSASSSSTASSAAVPESSEFVSAAVGFVKLWAEVDPGLTQAQWQAELTPLATDDYAKALESTDIDSLPDAQPDGEPVVRFLAQDSAMIAIPLSNGESVLVTVVAGDGDSDPLVSDVQPNTGD